MQRVNVIGDDGKLSAWEEADKKVGKRDQRKGRKEGEERITDKAA